MKNMTMKQFYKERNSSQNTQRSYNRSVKYYEKLTQHTITELLEIADKEETTNIRWKNTQTRKWLLEYREHLYNNYTLSTAQLYLTAILTIYRHFEITIPPLPYYSTKNLKTPSPINYNDLPDRDILRECIEISNPLTRAIILLMSSSGISRVDILNLTINDYLTATKNYHNHHESIKYAINEMQDQEIIPEFHLQRQKTGQKYITFCSHEATHAINQYLLTRTEPLHYYKPLFKINPRYFNKIFERLNNHFQLGKQANGYNRLTPHMLRRYHASQLAEAGITTEHINLLQGRKIQGVAHQSYIRIKPETLREEYIDALPYLVIDETTKYKTELEQVKEENKEYKTNLDNILERLEQLEANRPTWDEFIRR